MYGFILNMWIMKRITEAHVRAYEAKGTISKEEADMILATPQMA